MEKDGKGLKLLHYEQKHHVVSVSVLQERCHVACPSTICFEKLNGNILFHLDVTHL